MTQSNATDNQSDSTTTDAASASAPGPGDPRFGLAQVGSAVGDLMASTTDPMLGNATPCPEFTVKELLEHMVMVMRRIAAIGAGDHWSTVEAEAQDSDWHDSYQEASHAAMQAWTDAAKLEQTLEVPWGEMPGAPMLMVYTAELATHGWDLATATDREFSIDDDLLHGALMAIKFVPAQGRKENDPDMPFSEVVDPGPDAPLLLQIAGWAGRQVV